MCGNFTGIMRRTAFVPKESASRSSRSCGKIPVRKYFTVYFTRIVGGTAFGRDGSFEAPEDPEHISLMRIMVSLSVHDLIYRERTGKSLCTGDKIQTRMSLINWGYICEFAKLVMMDLYTTNIDGVCPLLNL